MTTFRVDGGSGDDYNKDLLTRKAKEELNAQGVKKPTSEQINAEIDKLAKKTESKKDLNNAKDLKVKGFYVEKNPDENTFVNFNDGARNQKLNISYPDKEQGIDPKIGISYLSEEQGEPPMTIGKLIDPKIGQEFWEKVQNGEIKLPEMDEEAQKQIRENIEKMKNGGVELPKLMQEALEKMAERREKKQADLSPMVGPREISVPLEEEGTYGPGQISVALEEEGTYGPGKLSVPKEEEGTYGPGKLSVPKEEEGDFRIYRHDLPVHLDPETLKMLQDYSEKIKNGEIEFPKPPIGAGTYALGENGDAATTMALGEEGGGSVKVDDEMSKKIQEAVEQLKNKTGADVKIDDDTWKTLQEVLEKIKNGEIKLPKSPIEPGTYSLGETGDATPTTMALGEDGGFDIITSYSMGEEGGSAVTTAIGESGDGITTKAMNEEGGSAVTTAIGESGDGITTKAMNEEGGSAVTTAIGESGDGITTKATNEEGGTAFTAAIGEDGGFETITTYAMGEEGGDSVILSDDVKEKFRKLIEDLKNKNDKPILDEKATKNILELLEKIRNGEIKLPNNEVDAGTYGLNENGDVPVTTMSIGEEGGGQITTMALGEEGGDSEPKLL